MTTPKHELILHSIASTHGAEGETLTAYFTLDGVPGELSRRFEPSAPDEPRTFPDATDPRVAYTPEGSELEALLVRFRKGQRLAFPLRVAAEDRWQASPRRIGQWPLTRHSIILIHSIVRDITPEGELFTAQLTIDDGHAQMRVLFGPEYDGSQGHSTPDIDWRLDCNPEGKELEWIVIRFRSGEHFDFPVQVDPQDRWAYFRRPTEVGTLERPEQLGRDLVRACRRRIDGHWELLAAAAGDPNTVDRLFSCVAPEELALGTASRKAVAPSVTESRVEALSVSCLERVSALVPEWEAIEANPFLDAALRAARAQLGRSGTPEPPADGWWWNDQLGANSFQARDLRQRPLRDAALHRGDLERAVRAGGQLLLALSAKDLVFANGAFDSFLENPSGLDPFVLALLVQTSRGLIAPARWIPETIRRLESAHDARDVAPLAYVLLSRRWTID